MKFQKLLLLLLTALLFLAPGCKTLDIAKYYTKEDRNIIPNIETKLDYEIENLFYLNQFANMRFLYKRMKQDLIADARLIYYNEMEKFHARTGRPTGQLHVKIKNVNLHTSAIWATVVSGLTICTLNLFGFPLLGYQCTTTLEMMMLDQKQTLIGIYPGRGTGKGFAGLYFSYNITDAQKKAHLESFKKALSDALGRIETDKNIVTSKLNSGEGKTDSEASIQKTVTELSIVCDVDSMPQGTTGKKNNLFALVIGNEDYKKYQDNLSSEANVEFARRDALTFAGYCKNIFGVPDENLMVLTDAIGSQMKREIEKLSKLVKYCNGEAEIIFYYAGHGFPDEETKEPYLIPCDISGIQVKDGIKLNWLYEKLTENNIKRVTVFLDACFSGGARNQGLVSSRGVKVLPKKENIPGKLVVFAASSNDQSAYPYKEKQHGLFTYFLLKIIKERKGNTTYKELFDYVYSNVGRHSLRVNNAEQEPSAASSNETETLWEKWRIAD
ncbi:MAG: caspase family protein [Bacteroidia bacterium]|nr:caspase family protein [Bacteroidia bacterium]